MKYPLLLSFVAIIVLASCSSSYKTGQTPDDVYFSKGKERVEKVRYERNSNDEYYYDDRMSSAEERRLRMRMRDYRWRQLDEYDYYYGSRYGGYYDYYSYRYSPYSTYYYSPYSYYNSGGYYPYYSGFYSNRYNGFFSPYFGIPVGSKGYIMQAQNSSPRKANLDAYREAYRSGNTNVESKGVRQTNRVYRQPSLDNGYERRSAPVYNSNRSSNESSRSDSRTYSPSSNSSSSGSSDTRSSGSISRPSRGN